MSHLNGIDTQNTLHEWKAFEGMERKIVKVSVYFSELVSLRDKQLFGPRPQNRILVPFRGSFQNF